MCPICIGVPSSTNTYTDMFVRARRHSFGVIKIVAIISDASRIVALFGNCCLIKFYIHTESEYVWSGRKVTNIIGRVHIHTDTVVARDVRQSRFTRAMSKSSSPAVASIIGCEVIQNAHEALCLSFSLSRQSVCVFAPN